MADGNSIHLHSHYITKFIDVPQQHASNPLLLLIMTQKDQKVYRVYADGVFDCFHLGHANVLKQAKQSLGPNKKVHLIAGVCKQEDIEKFKGPTIQSEYERFELVKACKWVDEVIPGPWIIDQKFLTDNNIDYVAHDDIPYVTAGVEDAYALCKKLGKFVATERTKGISTSDLVTRVIADRDRYIARNLKRGVSRQQLNLGLVQFIIFKLRTTLCPNRNVPKDKQQ